MLKSGFVQNLCSCFLWSNWDNRLKHVMIREIALGQMCVFLGERKLYSGQGSHVGVKVLVGDVGGWVNNDFIVEERT